jgi:hypothetical protein
MTVVHSGKLGCVRLPWVSGATGSHRGAPDESRLHWHVLLGIMFVAAAAPVVLHAAAQQEVAVAPELAQLASQFCVYRNELRKEQQPPRPELRDWKGPVHQLMSEVGECLQQGHYPAHQVLTLLGKPDELLAAGSRHNGVLVGRNESHWVYWWRGGHDYLYLIVRHGRVAQARWWYAGE